MSDDAEQQLRQFLEIREFFSIQLDESTDICEVFQLHAFMMEILRSC
jgi:hypothetical protein